MIKLVVLYGHPDDPSAFEDRYVNAFPAGGQDAARPASGDGQGDARPGRLAATVLPRRRGLLRQPGGGVTVLVADVLDR
jgi:hypothetical protein